MIEFLFRGAAALVAACLLSEAVFDREISDTEAAGLVGGQGPGPVQFASNPNKRCDGSGAGAKCSSCTTKTIGGVTKYVSCADSTTFGSCVESISTTCYSATMVAGQSYTCQNCQECTQNNQGVCGGTCVTSQANANTLGGPGMLCR